MVIPEVILRLTVGADLYEMLEDYRLKSEAEMPWAYRKDNPANQPPNVDRSRHNDWFFCKDTTRLSTARIPPLPFMVIKGPSKPEWINFNTDYPLSPDRETRTSGDGFQVLVDRGGYGMVHYAAFIDGAWRPCFKKYTRAVDVPFLGRYRFSFYYGLHQDLHHEDAMCYIEPFAMSFVKEK